jgi:AmmeMemoRadiSam system protein A
MTETNPELYLTIQQKIILLKLARETILASIVGKEQPRLDYSDKIFLEERGAFVTLHKKQKLRGCIGFVKGFKPLLNTIQEMAKAAAFRDPRFSPVQADEVGDLEIEISVLSPLKIIDDVKEIKVGVHGILLENQIHSGLLLPQVATEYGWDHIQFLQQTCIKAGLPRDDWKEPNTIIKTFSADVFSEKDLIDNEIKNS